MSGPREYDRRSFILAGVGMLVLLAIGALISGFLIDSNDAPMGDTNPAVIIDEATGDTIPVGKGRPRIIPEPGSGHAPETPGEPGGWQQTGLFVALCLVIVGIGVGVFIGGKKARVNKDAWRHAADPGQEELRRERGRAPVAPDGEPATTETG